MPSLLFKLVTLFLISHVGLAWQPPLFLASVASRRMLDFRNGFASSSSTDVKLTAANEASCYLSLKAHSDSVLSEVKDTTLLATKILSDTDKVSSFFEQLEICKKGLKASGLPASSMKFSVHVSLGEYIKIPVTTYFTMDLPPLSPLPVFGGQFDNTCRVEARGDSKRLVLKNVDLYETGEVGSSEDTFDGSEMAMNYGAQGILLDVRDEATVDIYSLLSCELSNEVDPQYMALGDSVTVGHIRELLASEDFGIQQNRARSFMVIGFHPSDFSHHDA